MKTIIYSPKPNKPSRQFRYVTGDCLERAGLRIPHGGYAIIDRSIQPQIGDLVHCNDALVSIGGYIKQVKEINDGTVVVGTAYTDESRDFTFEACEIYGVVTEVFCKLWNDQVYCRDAHHPTEKGGEKE